MNQELEGKVPVAEQVKEIESVDEAIQTEYALTPDGTIVKEDETEEQEKV